MRGSRSLPKPFSPEELRRLEEACSAMGRRDVWTLIVWLCETGLRISEACAVTTEEARSWPRPRWYCRLRCRHHASIRLTGKGGRERMVPLSPAALRAAHELLGQTSNGHLLGWSPRGVQWLMQQVGQRAGVHAHPHRCRHTAATRWINRADAYIVADVLGHASLATTKGYARLDERRLRRVLR
jgi:integrase